MDELNVTPQPSGDQPPNNEPNPEGEASRAPENAGAFNLESEKRSETKPNIESELLQPNQGEEQAAVDSEAPAPVMPSAMEEQSNPAQLEKKEPSEETKETDSVLTTNEAPKKGGIPKWAMIAGGVVGLGAIVVGAMFATDNWPFKGQLSDEIIDGSGQILLLDEAAPEYCPDGQYYDAGEAEILQNRLELLDGETGNTGNQQDLRLLNAIPTAKAQRFNATNADLLELTTESNNEAALIEENPLNQEYSTTFNGNIKGESTTFDREAALESGNGLTLEAEYIEGEQKSLEAEYIEGEQKSLEAEYIEGEQKSLEAEYVEGEQKSLEAEYIEEGQKSLESEYIEGDLRAAPGLESEYVGEITEFQVENGRSTGARVQNTSTFDRTKCKPVPPTDCDLINKLLESPEAYFISPATLKNLNEWKVQNCQEKTIETRTPIVIPELAVKTCGENQELVASSNECACKPGYFELESAASYAEKTDPTRLNTIDTVTRDNILEEAAGATLATNNNSPQNTLTLLNDGTESTGFAINNNLSDTGSEERTGLAINSNLTDESANRTNLRTNSVAQLVCVNCEELKDRIGVLKTRLGSLDDLDITDEQRATQESVLNAEVDRLEAKAKEENCEEERTPLVPLIPEVTIETKTCDELAEGITTIQGYPTATTTPEIAQELAVLVKQAEEQGCEIPEKNVCAEYAEESSNRISLGDFAGSFNQQISYLDASCIRALDPCDAKLAYATVAKEYRSLASETDDANFFEQEYLTRRDDYMNDLACVPDKPGRCIEIEGRLAEGYTFNARGDLSQALTLDTPVDNSILTLDEVEQTNRITGNDFARESNLLSQTNLNQRITENLESRRVLNDKEYQDLYCQPFVTPRIDNINPITPIEDSIPPESPVNPPVDPMVNPPIDPIVEPPLAPPTPEEELAASAPDNNFQAPAAPSPEEVNTGESNITPPVVPPSDTTELAEIAESGFVAPAAPSEPEVIADTTELSPATPEMPEITEAPLITKTGPETFIFFFAFIASQMYYFRRRIYAFVENR